jgi:hypothetical protein
MNDLAFWGVIVLGLVVLLAVRWAIPVAGGRLSLRPMSKAVLNFIDDRQRNGWLFLISFWAAVVIHPVIAVILYALQSTIRFIFYFIALAIFVCRLGLAQHVFGLNSGLCLLFVT